MRHYIVNFMGLGEKRIYWKLRLIYEMGKSVQAALNFPLCQYIIFMQLSRVDNSENSNERANEHITTR